MPKERGVSDSCACPENQAMNQARCRHPPWLLGSSGLPPLHTGAAGVKHWPLTCKYSVFSFLHVRWVIIFFCLLWPTLSLICCVLVRAGWRLFAYLLQPTLIFSLRTDTCVSNSTFVRGERYVWHRYVIHTLLKDVSDQYAEFTATGFPQRQVTPQRDGEGAVLHSQSRPPELGWQRVN